MQTHAGRFACALALLATLTQAQETSWPRNEAMLTYFQATSAIREHALEEFTTTDIVQESLRLFLTRHDAYSRLLTPVQYGRYRTSRQQAYHGVGIELARNREGAFHCIPYPESPAVEAGIQEGDELLAVDDQPVHGWPLETLGAVIRGEPDTSVQLSVRTARGAVRMFSVQRRALRAPSVSSATRDGIPMTRIYSFSADTPTELQRALQQVPDVMPLVLDLRGNPGGNLFDAVDTARLFLAPTQTIVEVQGRSSTTTYRCDSPPAYPQRSIWILQDESTASAAEVFIAALTENGRAQSIGQRSYGKGRTQRIVELMDGSALLLTDGMLIPPSGKPFDGVGLVPSIEVKEEQTRSTLSEQLAN